MGLIFSIGILIVLQLGLSSQNLDGPSSFLYFNCLRGRSVNIKLDTLDNKSYRFEDLGTHPDILECFTKCGYRTGLVLFSKSRESRNCVCVFPENNPNQRILEQEFHVAPSDLSGDCTIKEDITACYIGQNDAYSLYCNQERTLSKDRTFCDEISDTGNFNDPAWMSGNFGEWKEHMNDFPKCVKRDHIQVWEPSFILEDFEVSDPVTTCREKSGNAKYFMIGFAQDGQTRTCIPAETYESFTFPDTVGTGIVLTTDCQPCYPGDFKTCGSPQSFSIYCNSDECKSFQVQEAHYHYFGCTAKVPDWGNSEGFFLGEKTTLRECISNCSMSSIRDYNIFIAAQHVNDDATESEASVECRCFNFRNDAPHLGLHSRTSIEGCERGWSPPVGGPAGNFKDRILQYAVYCHSGICSSILPSYVAKPITHCCHPEDCAPATTSPTNPTTSTPDTTDKTTTTTTTTITPTTSTTKSTSSSTTTTTTITTPTTTTTTTTTTTAAAVTTSPPCYFCPGRFDQRGYFWNTTCAGHFIVASDSCPEGTSGNAFWYCDLETLDFVPLQPNRVGCIPTWIENVVDQANTPNSDPKEITSLILENICHFNTSLEQITSGTLIKIIEVGFLLPTRMTDPGNEMNYHRNVTNTFDIVLDYVQIVSDLLHHEVAWLEYDDDLILQNSTNLLKSAENIAFFLLQIEGAKVGFDRLITDSRDEVRMYTQSTFSRNESLPTMPRPPFIQLDGPSLIWGDWRSVGIQFCTQGIFDQIFHPSRNDLGLTSVELHSVAKISTFSINEWTPLASDGTVKVSFDHTNETEVRGTRYCVFWDEEELQWSQGGCVLSFESTLLNTVCVCNHTTNFAVLFDVGGVLDDLSDVALAFLNILSTILCTVSAIGTLLTFAILLFSKLPSSPRTIIQMNRAFSLFCLYLLFLLGIDPTILGLPDWMCRGVAVFIHFFGLSSFFWTSLEGIQLYRALVNKRLSDDDGRYFKLLRFVIGYGISLVIVFLTLVIQFVMDADNAYEHENDEPEDEIALCWLRENSFIWAFVGPALAAILLNFIIMLRTVKVVYRVQKRINRRGLAEVKGHLKSWTILTFLLGITWASGLLINKVTAKYGAYIFVALNGSLGIFTFIHSILLNPSVLGELKIRLGILDKNEFNLNLGGDRANALKQYTRKNRRQGIKSELRHHQRPEYVTENSFEMSSPDECSLPTSSIGSSHRSPRQVPRLLNAPEPNRPGFLFGRRKSSIASIAQLSHRDRSQMVSSQQSSSQRVILAQGVGRAFAVPGPSKRINGSI